jgi:hypothetical protein
MKKIRMLLLSLLIPVTFCSAQVAVGSWGLMFDISDAFNVNAVKDGYQVGAGCKFYPLANLALRALIGIDHVASEDAAGVETVTTAFAFGLAGEWHFTTGAVSPYLGGLFGVRTLAETGQPNLLDFYFGALFGVEATIYQNLSLFAEYDLIASVDAAGFSVKLGDMNGTGQGALFGLIVYF